MKVASLQSHVPVPVFGLGTVEARVASNVGFEVGTTLMEVKVDHGDRVNKGDVIARLNLGGQEAKVAKAKTALLNAEAGIKKSAASLEKARAVRREAGTRQRASLNFSRV